MMTMIMVTVMMVMVMEMEMEMVMEMMAMPRWDQKTYKWSVVVRQEAEAGSLIEVVSKNHFYEEEVVS